MRMALCTRLAACWASARERSPQWFLLLGFGFLVIFAIAQRVVVIPYIGMIKSFYGLSALVPFCAVAAMGLDFLFTKTAKARWVLVAVFGLWALTSYASFWIVRGSSAATLAKVKTL